MDQLSPIELNEIERRVIFAERCRDHAGREMCDVELSARVPGRREKVAMLIKVSNHGQSRTMDTNPAPAAMPAPSTDPTEGSHELADKFGAAEQRILGAVSRFFEVPIHRMCGRRAIRRW